jgi:hypothetical protein
MALAAKRWGCCRERQSVASGRPGRIDEQWEAFTVKDANGQPLAYVSFDDEPQRQMSMEAAFAPRGCGPTR